MHRETAGDQQKRPLTLGYPKRYSISMKSSKMGFALAISLGVCFWGCPSPQKAALPAPASSSDTSPPPGGTRSASENSPLLKAVLSGNLAAARLELEKGAAPNSRHNSGRTALMMASLRGQVPMMNLLIQKGAKVDETDSEGMTALMWAAFGGSRDALSFLLQKEANKALRSKNGETAADWGRDHPEIVLLLKAGG